jgi:hypothetical protein
MKRSAPLASACRHCRHYLPEGRRGGHCGQLNVPVQSSWKACSLALPVFSPSWEFEKIVVLKTEVLETLPYPVSANYERSSTLEKAVHSVSSSEKMTA